MDTPILDLDRPWKDILHKYFEEFMAFFFSGRPLGSCSSVFHSDALLKLVVSRKMAEQIDRYGEKLFAGPIKVDTLNGPIAICPQRANNILEQSFRGARRAYRRKTGNNSMRRTLHAMLADTPLVKNLANPHYLEILLDGKFNLEELFADLKPRPSGNYEDLQANTDRILPGFRKLMKLEALPEHMIRLFSRSPQDGQIQLNSVVTGFLGSKAGELKGKFLELYPDDPGLNSLANWRKFESNYTGSGVLLSFLSQK